MAEMTLAQVKTGAVKENVEMGFGSSNAFTEIQRVGKMFAESNMVPRDYSKNIGNSTIAIEIALRMRISPLMVMHNLHVIQGRPAWSAAFLIATFNSCGRYSSLRYHMLNENWEECKPGEKPYACYCSAIEKTTNAVLEGTVVTMDIAKMEGWTGKTGSKWKTMPEQMLRYRAASWFIRTYAPEVSMGLYTEDEVEDFGDDKGKVIEIKAKPKVVEEQQTQEQEQERELIVEAETIKEEEDVKKATGLRKQLIDAIVYVAGDDVEKQEALFRKANGGSDKHSMSEIPDLSVSACQYLLTRVQQIADGEGESEE